MAFRGGGAVTLNAVLHSIGLIFSSSPGHADEPIEEVSIEYRDGACGNESEFLVRVRARTSRFELVNPSPDARHFEVSIEPQGDTYVAQLSIVSDDESKQTRKVQAPTCEELVDAMALMTALAIDPSAPAINPGSPSDEPREDDPGTKNETKEERRIVPKKPTHAPHTPSEGPRPQENGHRWTAGGGLHFAFNAGSVRKPLWGGLIDIAARSKKETIVSPEARFFGVYQAGARLSAEVGAAGFRLYGGGVEVCPVRLGLGKVVLRPCASGMLAALAGRGLEVNDARVEETPYSALGAGARASYPLHSHVELETRVFGQFPLRRDRFLLGEDIVSRAHVISGVATLGVTFWL